MKLETLCHEVMQSVAEECDEYGVSESVKQAIVHAAKYPFRIAIDRGRRAAADPGEV